MTALLDFSSNDFRDQLGNELLEVARRALSLNNVEHLLSDLSLLGRLSVGSLGDLVGTSSSETNDKDSEEVTVGRLDVLVSLDEGLPLSYQRSELVRGEVHTVEVGEAGSARDFFDTETELSEGLFVVLVQVGEGGLDDSSLQGVVGVLETLGSVDEGLYEVSVLEEGGGLDIVPVLSGERVNGTLLLATAL